MAWSDPNSVLNPSTGAVISAAWGDMLNGNLLFLYQPPRCNLSRVSTAQTISSNDFIDFDVENLDTDSMWTAGTPDRITPPTAGRYQITTWVQFNSVADTTNRKIGIYRNGSLMLDEVRLNISGVALRMQLTAEAYMDGDDYFQIYVEESSASSVNIIGATWCRWVAPS